MKDRSKIALSLVLAVLAGVVISTQLTIFVVQPIGAVPEGRTLIISRLSNLTFIDSADAICERLLGGVSLFGRAAALARVMDQATIYLRLPYSATLYDISTGGRRYDK